MSTPVPSTDAATGSTKYAHLSVAECDDLAASFAKCAVSESGTVDIQDVYRACKKAAPYEDIMRVVKQVTRSDRADALTLDEFLQVNDALTLCGNPVRRRTSVAAVSKITRITGATESTQHSIDEDEKNEFAAHINQALQGDKCVGARLPFGGEDNALFVGCKDGLVLSKLINCAVPDTIDERVLNKGRNLNAYQMAENNNVVINSAKAIGCSVVNIGSQDIIEGREHLVLGLIWQIIKIGLFSKISLLSHPELFRLLQPGETLEELLRCSPETILLRWFNYHLAAAHHVRRVANFSADIADSVCYTVLLHQLCPSRCSLAPLALPGALERAEAVLGLADAIECRKYVTPKAVVAGNPKLNLAFVAHLFNSYPGLAPLSAKEQAEVDEKLFGGDGSREARAFALWMNSLAVEPFVNNIFYDLRDGRVLLQLFDKIKPGIVQPQRANMKAGLSRFKMIENTNYAIYLGKELKFSLVGIQGADVTDGSQILTLGLVWQLMREHIVQTLLSLSKHSRTEVKDADMIHWATDRARKAGKKATMASFRDPSLRTSHFFLDLLDAQSPGTVNYNLVTAGADEHEAKMNAKYAISIARKLGATLFLLPEDIVEVKAKMILTFVGSLMALDQLQA